VKPIVVVSAYNVAAFTEGGGHFWVYMQYVLGLRACGCEVYWLERFVSTPDAARDEATIRLFLERAARFGLAGRVIMLVGPDPTLDPDAPLEFRGLDAVDADAVFRRADLVLNFHYAIDAKLLRRFRRTALVDIDPGLLQFWISRGQLLVPHHDVHFTTGETVGRSDAPFPDCGRIWHSIRPAVSLERWPVAAHGRRHAMTSVSGWNTNDWIVDGDVHWENTKRVSFLEYKELPSMTAQPLELALYLCTDEDHEERRLLERLGWTVRPSREVAGSPEQYQAYVQDSRGEFSCAKPSYTKFQNAWVSDRTLCYLASGRPVVVQDTGPSAVLPNGEGMFRFSTPAQAAEALAAMNADYDRHCRAARALAERHFDAAQVAQRILDIALT
jgi:hypothetical protein